MVSALCQIEAALAAIFGAQGDTFRRRARVVPDSMEEEP
jgi:hypothetical protein